VTTPLAYYDAELITAVRRFIVQVTRSNVIDLILV